jgi:hypothetical protein
MQLKIYVEQIEHNIYQMLSRFPPLTFLRRFLRRIHFFIEIQFIEN